MQHLEKKYKITPEVEFDDQFVWLVRIDQEVVGCTDSQEKAKLIVDSFAAAEVKRMSNERTKVLREDLKDGEKVILSTQALGMLYNSGITKALEVDLIRAPCVRLIKARQELPRSTTPIPIPPPLPQEYLNNRLPSDLENSESSSEYSTSESENEYDFEEYEEEVYA